MKDKNTSKGITLIAIIITIILMLILTSVTINVVINGDLFEYAKNAKTNTEIANEKETIQNAALIAESTSKTGKITVEDLQKAINKVINEGTVEVLNNGETLVVKFEKSGSFYELDGKGSIKEFTPYEDTTPGELALDENGNCMVESIEDLVVLSAMVNGGYSDEDIDIEKNNSPKVVLMRDLDFRSSLSYCDYTTTIYNGYLGIEDKDVTLMEALTNTDKYQGFIPIGNMSNFFNSVFDGQNYYIRNLCEKTDNYGGLFGNAGGYSTIKNITVTGTIESTSYAGGIVGYWSGNTGNKIYNCINYVNVSGTNCGGIAGYSAPKTSFMGCINYGDIIASSSAGGIVGNGSSVEKFEQCANLGFVSGNTVSGGIIGSASGSGAKMYFYSCLCMKGSNVKSDNTSGTAGGMLGSRTNGLYVYYYNCINLGKVYACYSGGFIGNTKDWEYDTLVNCFGGGNISGTYPGGLVGFAPWGATIATGINCYYLLNDTVTNSVGKSTQKVESTAVTEVRQGMIDSLNSYIEDDPDGIGTTGWAKWVYNEKLQPTLDFTTTWDVTTKTWVKK